MNRDNFHDRSLNLDEDCSLLRDEDVESEKISKEWSTASVFVGLFVGTILNFSNTYFGLQTGELNFIITSFDIVSQCKTPT